MLRKAVCCLCLKLQINLLETVLIKKAKQAVLHSPMVDTVENSVDIFFLIYQTLLPFISYFPFISYLMSDGMCISQCLGNKYLQKVIHLNSVVTTWMQSSKENKTSFFYEVDVFYVHL